MEDQRYFIRLDKAAYGNWHAIGVLEDLATDEDVAKFLVSVYCGQTQRKGRGSSLRCVHCHCSLNLCCSTCHTPSHLALPSHPSLTSPPPPLPQNPAPPFLSSHPPPPPPHTLGTSAHGSNILSSDADAILDVERVRFEVKDEDDLAEDLQEEGGGTDVDLDMVKTESSPLGACDNESASTEPAITVHFEPPARVTRRQSRNASRTTLDRASDLAANQKNMRTRTKKAVKLIQPKKQSRSKGLWTESSVGSRQKRRKKNAELEQVENDDIKESDDAHSETEQYSDDASQKTTHSGQKKRKPCASQDLEKGHVLSVEERRLAQIHVYDQSFIDRHKLEDASLLESGKSVLKPGRQALVVKSVPEKRGRKQKKRICKIRRPSVSEVSSSEEDTVDYEIGCTEDNPVTSVNGFEPTDDNSQRNITPKEKNSSNPEHCSNLNEDAPDNFRTLKHILSTAKHKCLALDGDGDSEDRQPFRILVSGLKILPLLTSSGNPAHKFYTYFECAHCKKAFTHKRAFNSHVQGHINRKIYKCSFCDRSFERPCTKMIHEKRHKHECEICGQKYLEYSMIKEHMKLHVMKCARCPFQTSDFLAYKKHKSSCGLVKPTLQCEICGVRLKSHKALSFHIAAIHQNNRPFKCTMCEKLFVLQTKLNAHIRERHTEGGRRFHCDKCGYRAFHAHSLRIHQRCVHSNERPYTCPQCPSAFARKIYLTIHMRKHTGEKPHRCSECLQTFTQRPSLTRHIRTHHQAESALGRKMKDLQNAQ
ncbi:hypothetical protein ACOMHN_013441 [Nucella lapillus]